MVYLYDAHGDIVDLKASWKNSSDFLLSNRIARTHIETDYGIKLTISTIHLGRGKTIESPDMNPRLFEIAYQFENAEALGLPDPQAWKITNRYKSWDSALVRHSYLKRYLMRGILAPHNPYVVEEVIASCPICGNTENKKITIDT